MWLFSIVRLREENDWMASVWLEQDPFQRMSWIETSSIVTWSAGVNGPP
jgi:hypothetical protein